MALERGFTVLTAPQRSPAWAAARLGRLTASRAAAVLAKGRDGGEAIGRRQLRQQLALERLTGVSHERLFCSTNMRIGMDREPAAAACYAARTGQVLTRTGFVQSTTLPVGVSLDAHVGDYAGLVEFKCPLDTTHWEYLHAEGKIPGAHRAQITHALWITGARWCEWVSYHPGFPPTWRLQIVRVVRDEVAIAAYARAAIAFLKEVEAELEGLSARIGRPSPSPARPTRTGTAPCAGF
jgi:exodeoxyribonuclease (lambda-induced)